MDKAKLLSRFIEALPIVLALGIAAVEVWEPTSPAVPGHPAAISSGRVISDQQGRSVRLPAVVNSVGTPGVSLASLVVVLSGGRKLTAGTTEVRNNPWLNKVVPASMQLATPFTRPAGVNLEALLAVKPDLVALWGSGLPLAQRLEDENIPVLHLSYGTPEEMKGAIRVLGKALGPEESARGEALIRYYENNLKRVSSVLADLPEKAKPRVYYASIAPLYTEGRLSMVDAWIKAGGGINVAAEGGLKGDGPVHLEDVLLWNPDVIVTLDAAQQQQILSDPRWRGIKAVKQGRVLVNPGGVNAWCTRAAEAALQVLWAAKVFHSERFRSLDLEQETRRFYREFYGYALNDHEVAQVLRSMSPVPTQISPSARRLP